MPTASTTKQSTEARQASLIAAALALAAERAPADVTTAQLAQAIGVTQGAVFRHFESKEAIWLAVLDATSARLLANLQAAAARHKNDPLCALQAVFEAHVAFVVAHPGMPRLMFQELQHPQESPLKARVGQLMFAYRQLLLGLLMRAQAQGQLAEGTDLQAATVLFVGSIQGLVIQSLLANGLDTMQVQAPSVFALYRAGLTARAPSIPPSPPVSQGRKTSKP